MLIINLDVNIIVGNLDPANLDYCCVAGYTLYITLFVCVSAPRLVTAACYRELGEKMKLLWTKELRMNTVHVSDVVKAAWHVARLDGGRGEVYNLADKADTS